MARAHDQALLLRRHPFGESSLVVHAFTRRHGRVPLVAKGAYRPKSRYSGVLDLFDTLQLEWSVNPRAELQTLVEASITTRRKTIPADLSRYRAALADLELCDLAVREGTAEEALFDLVSGSLDRLAAGRVEPVLERIAFDLRFLHNLGLAPALERCAACGEAAESRSDGRGHPAQASFSAGAGGRLCRRCANEARASGRRVGTLSVDVLRVARSLLEATPETLARIRLQPDQAMRVADFVQRFLEFHIESRPRSRRGLRTA